MIYLGPVYLSGFLNTYVTMFSTSLINFAVGSKTPKSIVVLKLLMLHWLNTFLMVANVASGFQHIAVIFNNVVILCVSVSVPDCTSRHVCIGTVYYLRIEFQYSTGSLVKVMEKCVFVH